MNKASSMRGAAIPRRPGSKTLGTARRDDALRSLDTPDLMQALKGRPVDSPRQLAMLVKSYAGHKHDGRVASYRTQDKVKDVMFMLFKQLRACGYKVEPRNIGGRQVEALRAHFADRLAAGTIQGSTVQEYFSTLRRFCTELGKHGLVPPIDRLFPDGEAARTAAADHDKSLEGNGVDLARIVVRVFAKEPWVAMALLAQDAFGLRRREAICAAPHADAGRLALRVDQGAKGGRARIVPITDEKQAAVLALLREYVSRRGQGPTLGPQGPGRDLARNIDRYKYVVSACGLTKDQAGATGHGLRAGYVMRELERVGIVPTVRGGDHAQPIDVQLMEQALRSLSERVGHSRIPVLAAYCGPLPKATGAQAAPETARG